MRLWSAIIISALLLAYLAARFPDYFIVTFAVIGAAIVALAVYIVIRFIRWAANQPGGRG